MSENSTAVAIKEADGYYDQNDFQKVYDTLVKHKSGRWLVIELETVGKMGTPISILKNAIELISVRI